MKRMELVDGWVHEHSEHAQLLSPRRYSVSAGAGHARLAPAGGMAALSFHSCNRVQAQLFH